MKNFVEILTSVEGPDDYKIELIERNIQLKFSEIFNLN